MGEDAVGIALALAGGKAVGAGGAAGVEPVALVALGDAGDQVEVGAGFGAVSGFQRATAAGDLDEAGNRVQEHSLVDDVLLHPGSEGLDAEAVAGGRFSGQGQAEGAQALDLLLRSIKLFGGDRFPGGIGEDAEAVGGGEFEKVFGVVHLGAAAGGPDPVFQQRYFAGAAVVHRFGADPGDRVGGGHPGGIAVAEVVFHVGGDAVEVVDDAVEPASVAGGFVELDIGVEPAGFAPAEMAGVGAVGAPFAVVGIGVVAGEGRYQFLWVEGGMSHGEILLLRGLSIQVEEGWIETVAKSGRGRRMD